VNKDKFYKVGFIKRAHGLKGEVTVVPDQTLPIVWDTLETIMVEQRGKLVPYFIENISMRPDKFFMKFEDVNSPEDTEVLKGCPLFLPQETRAELPDDDFYNDEVIGFEVEDEKHGVLGKVKEIEQAGPTRFLLVDYDNKEVMIPVQEPLLVKIDRESKKIRVNLPEGLLEL
jgi:16S rRNA processing protein RimM